MKKWIIKNRTSLILSLLGGISGYMYWKFVGCVSGTCAITSVWYRATLYGVVMGWLIGDIVNGYFKKEEPK